MFHTNPYDEHIIDLMNELQISEAAAKDIHLLRMKLPNRPELEHSIIEMHKAGIPVDLKKF